MIVKKIDSTLTPENEELVVQNLDTAESTLDFLETLTKEERAGLPKMSKKALDFVERALMHAKDNPQLVPPFLDLAAQERDLVLMKQVARILGVTDHFSEKLRDTYRILGAEAYAAAREFYRWVRTAAKSGFEKSDFLAKELGYYYKRQYSTKKPEIPKPEAGSDGTHQGSQT